MTRFLVGLAVMAGAVGAARGADPLVAAAAARTAAARSVDIRFRVTEFLTKGALSAGIGPKLKSVLPPADSTLEAENRLVFQDRMVRYENNLPMWHLSRGVVIRKPTLSVSNDDTGKFLCPDGMGLESVPRGAITRYVECEFIKTGFLTPLAMHFRGTDADVCGYPVQVLKPTGQQLRVRGTDCTEYTATLSPETVTVFWVGPAPDWLILKIQGRNRGRTTQQCEIEYDPTPAGGPAPARWAWDRFSPDGKLRESSRVVVTGYRRDEPLPADAFDITFPDGARIDDQRSGKSFRVLPSGALREVTPDGSDVPSASDIAQAGGWLERNRWLAGGGALAIVMVVWYGVRGRRRRAG